MKQLGGDVDVIGVAASSHTGETIINSLRKRRLNGELYERDPKVEALIAELAGLPRDELIVRAAVTKHSDPGYVPSECLVYFIRASRRDNNEAWFERLYRILIERVLRSLPRTESSDGKTESLTRGAVRDKVFGRLVELLSADSRRLCRQARLFRGALRWCARQPEARRTGTGVARREPLPAPRI
ncbi:hypothetical protein ACVWXM_003238 [Bradyrhizobium sp. GM7.3]